MQIQHDPELAAKLQAAEEARRAADREFSDDCIRRTGLVRGQVLRDRDTGCLYKVEGAHAYFSHGSARISITARRTYKTGRRDASTQSYIGLSNMELVG